MLRPLLPPRPWRSWGQEGDNDQSCSLEISQCLLQRGEPIVRKGLECVARNPNPTWKARVKPPEAGLAILALKKEPVHWGDDQRRGSIRAEFGSTKRRKRKSLEEEAGYCRPKEWYENDGQMFAIQPRLSEGGQFPGSMPPGVCQPELQPDSNSNFMEGAKDANENWHGMPGKVEPIPTRSSSESLSDNQALQASGLPEGVVRSPPEGAEIPGTEPEKNDDAITVCSPLEDNGYASSSLSIDSTSSSPEPACGTPLSPGPPDPLLLSVAHAVQQLQAQERYKEQEKEKHHVHLVMYRRLALLQWIRGLQHQLVDQQARLQDSFDTILDNRKELIRCLQQRAVPSRPQDQG
ncbi:hypothetical protein GW7_05397 [Heterocephalus glaber]|uniref:Uncharacterized protein n=1 Tax=Heterocephalus glaber TaxID=10181 RepID=G5C6E6_HETGA|nr:hypothetical protein GW7_05397 [Heterocephalus glaber]